MEPTLPVESKPGLEDVRVQFEKWRRIRDLFMSLIHTCSLNRVNPIAYLTALQEHATEMAANPNRWLPWNYTDAMQPQPP